MAEGPEFNIRYLPTRPLEFARPSGNCLLADRSSSRGVSAPFAQTTTALTRLQRAKAVVVCANGAETPRLLLLSASKQFPDGLANSSGLVGKYLMLNSGPSAMAVFEHPLNDYKGVAVSRILHDFYELDPQKLGFYGGGGLDARLDLTPISFAISGYDMGGLPPGTPRWGKEFKVALAHNYTRTLEILYHGTLLPFVSNSFSLLS